MLDRSAVAFAPLEHMPEAQAELALAAGTIVLTTTGECAVEDLRPGMQVITRNSGVATVAAVHHDHEGLPAVRIAEGAFGPRRPSRTLTLPLASIDRIYVRKNGVTAGQLSRFKENLTASSDAMTQTAMTVTLCFLRPQIIYGQGLELCALAER
jgi:hypothetical protein